MQNTTAQTEIPNWIDSVKLAELQAIIGSDRCIRPRLEGDWIIWDSASEPTMRKFVMRAKKAGYRAVFARDSRFGCHTDYLEA